MPQMQVFTIVVSVLALVVSVCGFVLALLNYRRDRSKVRAWSNICWHDQGMGVQKPVMHIFVANLGRRPVSILSLEMRAGRVRWWEPLRHFGLPALEGNPSEYVEKVLQNYLAHSAAIKLGEREVFEHLIPVEKCPELIAEQADPPISAQELYIQDATGTCYTVKKSKKHLKDLFRAWESGRSRPTPQFTPPGHGSTGPPEVVQNDSSCAAANPATEG